MVPILSGFISMNYMKHSKHSWARIIALLVIFAFAGFGLYLTQNINSDRPPSLSFGSSGYQGFLDKDGVFFKFEESDINRVAQFTAGQTRAKGIQYYYSESNISFEQIIKSIKPDLDNQCMVITYMADQGKFHIFPKGPFGNTVELKKTQLSSFELAPAHSFVIVCKKEYQTINIKHASEKPEDFQSSFDWLAAGWHLNAFSSDQNLHDATLSCGNRVEAIWVQNGDNSFSITELNSPKLAEGYYLAWVQLKGAPDSCREGSAGSSGSGDGSNENRNGANGGQGDEVPSPDTNVSIYEHLKQNYLINQNRLHDK